VCSSSHKKAFSNCFSMESRDFSFSCITHTHTHTHTPHVLKYNMVGSFSVNTILPHPLYWQRGAFQIKLILLKKQCRGSSCCWFLFFVFVFFFFFLDWKNELKQNTGDSNYTYLPTCFYSTHNSQIAGRLLCCALCI
jgi:hypothetical protein